MLSPIVVFVYNRADKAERLLESLAKNKLAKESVLYVFSDGPKKSGDEKVKAVRDFLDSYDFKSKFGEVYVQKAEVNKGLAASVIAGVTKAIDKYGKVIVVEDDNVVAEDYLDYMNGALDFYENNPKVWSISGFTHFEPRDYNHDVYAMGRINSYSWATWKRSWDATDWEVKDYDSFKYDFKKRAEFNKYGNDLSIMLDMQMNGEISSWAIRFSYSMFKHNMVAMFPCKSKVSNSGEDGSGTHIAAKKDFKPVALGDNSVVFENLDIDENVRLQYIKRFTYTVPVRIKHYFISVILPKSISKKLMGKKKK